MRVTGAEQTPDGGPWTHPGGADAHKHLQELGAVDGDEGDVGLAGRGFGQQGLPGSWRSGENGALEQTDATHL